MDTLREASAKAAWFISSMSLLEVANAVERRRLELDRPLQEWFRDALQFPGPRVIDITPEIACATVRLPKAFQGDPGDRVLAATAITEHLALCTHDDDLLRFGKQGIFSTLKVSEAKEQR